MGFALRSEARPIPTERAAPLAESARAPRRESRGILVEARVPLREARAPPRESHAIFLESLVILEKARALLLEGGVEERVASLHAKKQRAGLRELRDLRRIRIGGALASTITSPTRRPARSAAEPGATCVSTGRGFAGRLIWAAWSGAGRERSAPSPGAGWSAAATGSARPDLLALRQRHAERRSADRPRTISSGTA